MAPSRASSTSSLSGHNQVMLQEMQGTQSDQSAAGILWIETEAAEGLRYLEAAGLMLTSNILQPRPPTGQNQSPDVGKTRSPTVEETGVCERDRQRQRETK